MRWWWKLVISNAILPYRRYWPIKKRPLPGSSINPWKSILISHQNKQINRPDTGDLILERGSHQHAAHDRIDRFYCIGVYSVTALALLAQQTGRSTYYQYREQHAAPHPEHSGRDN